MMKVQQVMKIGCFQEGLMYWWRSAVSHGFAYSLWVENHKLHWQNPKKACSEWIQVTLMFHCSGSEVYITHQSAKWCMENHQISSWMEAFSIHVNQNILGKLHFKPCRFKSSKLNLKVSTSNKLNLNPFK